MSAPVEEEDIDRQLVDLAAALAAAGVDQAPDVDALTVLWANTPKVLSGGIPGRNVGLSLLRSTDLTPAHKRIIAQWTHAYLACPSCGVASAPFVCSQCFKPACLEACQRLDTLHACQRAR
jgi:hypothetical protein